MGLSGQTSLPLPPILLVEHRFHPVAVEPGFGGGVVVEVSVPEGGGDGEDGGVVFWVSLAAFAGKFVIGENGMFGVFQDEFVFAAGRQRGEDSESAVGFE